MDKSDWVLVPRELLGEARNIAMEWTLRGRVPECGKFGEIAQDLDAMLASAPQPPSGGETAYTLLELREAILDCLNLAHAEGAARKESETAAMADRLAAMAAALAQQPAPVAPAPVAGDARELLAQQLRKDGHATAASVVRQGEENALLTSAIKLIAALAQQPAAVDGAMRKVAAIAHSGGLIDMSEGDALTAIRRLTLPYWGREEKPEQVRATLAAQPGGGS